MLIADKSFRRYKPSQNLIGLVVFMPLESLLEFITTLMTDYLYAGVFLAALIETIIPPIPTMAVFPTAGFIASQNGLELPELFLLGIVGGLGASIGSTVIYLIALKLGRTVLLKYLKYVKVSEKKLSRVESWFQKYGDKAVLFGRMVPVFREMISVPAGLLKMKFPKFLAYTILGSCGWSITLIFIGYYFGIASLEFL
jgi:membrane protein DedA with SNARE-associated domain